MYSVEIKNLDLHYESVKVLQDLNLSVAQGEFLVLLGSSGCGKSTLLNCIAGLLEISAGQIFINGKNVTWAEPSQRGIGMVFQSYALYPQMTVAGNMSFGLKNAKVAKSEIKKRVAQAAGILQIEDLLGRKPAALSGGQRQRVAIGRALVRDAAVFLFDEPLSNLDAKLRTDLRVEIKRLHQKLDNTMIYVTHDQIEAMTLADRIAIMKGGKIMQLDSPAAIYNQPCNLYVAGFIGSPSMNFIRGNIKDQQFSSGALAMPLSAYQWADSSKDFSGAGILGIRPEHVITGELAAKAQVRLELSVDIIEPMGSDTLIYASLNDEEFRVRIDGQAEIKPGTKLTIGLDAQRLSLFDPITEARL